MTAGGLNNKKVVVCTFPVDVNNEFYSALHIPDIELLIMPTIRVEFIPFNLSASIDSYHWLVFTSKKGVVAFFDKQCVVASNKIAVIGSSTAKALEKYNVSATFIGSGQSAECFADELLPLLEQNQNVLLILGNLAPNLLVDKLKYKVEVSRVDVYQTLMPSVVDAKVIDVIRAGEYDVVAISSPSAIHNLVALLGQPLPPLRMVSIGTTTSKAIGEYHIEPLMTSKEQSYKGLALSVKECLFTK